MNNPLDVLLMQLWQPIAPYVNNAWVLLQRLYADAPSSLLVGVALGFVFSKLLRIVLTVVLVGVLALVAARVLGIAVPGLG